MTTTDRRTLITDPHRVIGQGWLELELPDPHLVRGPDGRAYTHLGMVQRTLGAFGFPAGDDNGVYGEHTAKATRRFQAAFAGGLAELPALHVDGIPGRLTWRALEQLPHLSPHFTTQELLGAAGVVSARRELVLALEELRAFLRRPLELEQRSCDVAGLHMAGLAADLKPATHVTRAQARAVERFSGIGWRADGRVIHVDLRHLSDRPRLRTPSNPARWSYPSRDARAAGPSTGNQPRARRHAT